MKGFVGEESEGVRFFGGFWDPQLRRIENFNAAGFVEVIRVSRIVRDVHAQRSCKKSKQERIASTPARNDELMDFCLRQDETVEGVNNRESGENSGSTNYVVGLGMIFLAETQKLLNVRSTVILAAGGFWRGLSEIRIAEKFVEESREETALPGQLRVFVEALAAFGEVGDEGVDEDVGGAGVKGKDVLGLCSGGDYGDVGYAAQVEGDAAEFFVTVEEVVGEGDEGGALASGGHVGGAEVADGGDAGAGGDNGSFANLQGRRNGSKWRVASGE